MRLNYTSPQPGKVNQKSGYRGIYPLIRKSKNLHTTNLNTKCRIWKSVQITVGRFKNDSGYSSPYFYSHECSMNNLALCTLFTKLLMISSRISQQQNSCWATKCRAGKRTSSALLARLWYIRFFALCTTQCIRNGLHADSKQHDCRR